MRGPPAAAAAASRWGATSRTASFAGVWATDRLLGLSWGSESWPRETPQSLGGRDRTGPVDAVVNNGSGSRYKTPARPVPLARTTFDRDASRDDRGLCVTTSGR